MGYLYKKATSPILEWMCVGIFLRYVVILWEESGLFLYQVWAFFVTVPGSHQLVPSKISVFSTGPVYLLLYIHKIY